VIVEMEIQMTEFNKMLDWKLLSGSHEFPGPDGGTCINEAAIIAAGFAYKKVGSWMDCPPCFSPLISQYAITLNDNLNDIDRQKLIPFVTKMAGTKGSQELENARALWFVQQIVNDDLFTIAKKYNEMELADLCFKAKTQKELKTAVDKFRSSSLSSLLSSLSLLSSSSLSSLLSSDKLIQRLEGLINFGRSRPEIKQSVALERLQKARACEMV
jgi:hypothetical protein